MQTHVLGRMETWVAMLEVVSVAAVAAAREALAVRAVTEPLGGDGGIGIQSDISGNATYYGGGGGGCEAPGGSMGHGARWTGRRRVGGVGGHSGQRRAQPTLGEGVVGMAGRVTLGETMAQLYLAAPASSSSATKEPPATTKAAPRTTTTIAAAASRARPARTGCRTPRTSAYAPKLPPQG